MKKKPAAAVTGAMQWPAACASKKVGENNVDYAAGLKKFRAAEEAAKSADGASSAIWSLEAALYFSPAVLQKLVCFTDAGLAEIGFKKTEFDRRLAEVLGVNPKFLSSKVKHAFGGFSVVFPETTFSFRP